MSEVQSSIWDLIGQGYVAPDYFRMINSEDKKPYYQAGFAVPDFVSHQSILIRDLDILQRRVWTARSTEIEAWPSREFVNVKNALGQDTEVQVDWLGYHSNYNWSTKYVTANCADCPCHITPAEAATVLRALNSNKGRRAWDVPGNQLGLCLWSAPGGKTLVPNRWNPKPRRCEYFGKQPE